MSVSPNLEGLSVGITKVAGVAPGHAARTARSTENSYNNPLGLLDWLMYPVGAGVAATNVTGKTIRDSTENDRGMTVGSTSPTVGGALNTTGDRKANSFYGNRIQNTNRNLLGTGRNAAQAANRTANSVDPVAPPTYRTVR